MDELIFKTKCAFCMDTIEVRQPRYKKKKPRHYCDEKCRADYSILHDLHHPQHPEIVSRRIRMAGIP